MYIANWKYETDFYLYSAILWICISISNLTIVLHLILPIFRSFLYTFLFFVFHYNTFKKLIRYSPGNRCSFVYDGKQMDRSFVIANFDRKNILKATKHPSWRTIRIETVFARIWKWRTVVTLKHENQENPPKRSL